MMASESIRHEGGASGEGRECNTPALLFVLPTPLLPFGALSLWLLFENVEQIV